MQIPHSTRSVQDRLDGPDQPLTILFISDNQELADMYRLKLQLDGYSVTLATTDEAKSERLQRRATDIVYLDLGLANRAGLAAYRRLRADATTKNLPIVLLSTRLAPEGCSAGLELGLQDFMMSSDARRPDAFWSEYSEGAVTRH